MNIPTTTSIFTQKLTIVCLFLLLPVSHAQAAQSVQEDVNKQSLLFIADDNTHKHVENILLKTTISAATERLALGQVNPSALTATPVGGSLLISLPGLIDPMPLFVNAIDQPMPSVVTYSGAVGNHVESEFIISIQGNNIFGTIKFNGAVFVLEPTTAEDHRHVVHQLNPALLQRSNEADFIAYGIEENKQRSLDSLTKLHHEKPVGQNKSSTTKQAANGVISVLFLYGSDVANADLKASQIVTEFNNALNRSAVSTGNRIVAAGRAQLVDDTFSGENRKVILDEQMDERSGVFTDIDIRMRSVNADVAFLLISDDRQDFGGLAFMLNSNKPFALSIDTYAIGDYSALHELGHVFGGAHALPLIEPELDSPYLAGHGLDISPIHQTIMGGYNTGLEGDTRQCEYIRFLGPNQICQRLPYFSNPAIELFLIDEYVSLGDSLTADMASVLETTMPQVASWGTYGQPTYSEPYRGFAFDPAREAHGIHISRSGSSYILYFYSFDANGQPEWFISTMPVSNFRYNTIRGTLQRVRFNHADDSLTFTNAGSFTLDYRLTSVNYNAACDGINRQLRPAVFKWSIDGERGEWCMRARPDINGHQLLATQDHSGVWFEQALNGWGISTQQVFRPGPSNTQNRDMHAVVYLYDSRGIGRWLTSSLLNNLGDQDFVFERLFYVTGQPRTAANQTSNDTNIGSLQMNFDVGPRRENIATLEADRGGAPRILWNRFDALLTMLGG